MCDEAGTNSDRVIRDAYATMGAERPRACQQVHGRCSAVFAHKPGPASAEHGLGTPCRPKSYGGTRLASATGLISEHTSLHTIRRVPSLSMMPHMLSLPCTNFTPNVTQVERQVHVMSECLMCVLPARRRYFDVGVESEPSCADSAHDCLESTLLRPNQA